MRVYLFAFTLTACLCLSAQADTAGSFPMLQTSLFYVAPNGSDSWSGRLAAPNRAKTDGPFATLPRAQRAVREMRRAQPQVPITVMLRRGTYYLTEPLVFTPEDSGSAEAPVTYRAYPKETVTISGGVPLTGWKVNEKGHWELTLPQVQAGEWSFVQLFVNGERRNRPRVPREGYYLVEQDLPPSPRAQEKGFDRFRFKTGQIRADWHNLRDVEALCFQVWTMARMRIDSVEEETRTVNFTGTTINTVWYSAFPTGNRYLLENVREALDEPGEWYLDRKSGLLTYIPRPGEDPARAVVIAPRLERIVEMRGSIAERRWVQHITFSGLTFAHTNWYTPPQGHTFAQAEVNLDGAITATGARDCRFEDCAVTLVGTYAMSFGRGCRRNTVERCRLMDLGAGGIKIGEMDRLPDEEEVTHHRVAQNTIAHGGRLHPAAVGVWLGYASHNTIANNDIYDFYYTGISVGWMWGYFPTGAHHNLIADNHIYQIGQGVLSDMGGIYLLGPAPGTVVRGNRIHDVQSYGYGGWGIYPDEGSSHLLIEKNVVYRTKSAGFHQHYGLENLVRNNIFAFGQEAQLMRTRAEDHLSFTLERNIVLWDEGVLLGSNWTGNNYRLNRNLYWKMQGRPFNFAGMSLQEWQAKGQDVDSVIADPLFVAPEKGDFRLKPGSPAEKIGFEPIDLSQAGRQDRPKPTRRPPAFPSPPPPQPIAQDFEEVSVGEKAPQAFTWEENEQATIRVTEETAASGKRSLKFIDTPNQKENYNPHLHYSPNYLRGVVHSRFALRVEPGVLMYHEWRDYSTPYRVGPSFTIEKDGALIVGGKRLTTLPLSRWIVFEIVCGVGRDATGTYDLTIHLPGRTPPLRYQKLACAHPEFDRLQWFGFVANGREDAVFYLDDLRLELKEIR